MGYIEKFNNFNESLKSEIKDRKIRTIESLEYNPSVEYVMDILIELEDKGYTVNISKGFCFMKGIVSFSEKIDTHFSAPIQSISNYDILDFERNVFNKDINVEDKFYLIKVGAPREEGDENDESDHSDLDISIIPKSLFNTFTLIAYNATYINYLSDEYMIDVILKLKK